MKIAIHQPYFAPYGGYFCSMILADIFVIYDDAQYPKEGYVNRNRFTKPSFKQDWLTLPLLKKPLVTKINEIEFANGASEKWIASCRKFRVFQERPVSNYVQTALLAATFKTPFDFIIRMMEMTREMLDLPPCEIRYSSKIKYYPKDQYTHLGQRKLYPKVKGQDRVLQICEHLEAKQYINASGGVGLYDKEEFARRGIDLKFLQPYQGNKISILERLVFEPAMNVRQEIIDNARLIP